MSSLAAGSSFSARNSEEKGDEGLQSSPSRFLKQYINTITDVVLVLSPNKFVCFQHDNVAIKQGRPAIIMSWSFTYSQQNCDLPELLFRKMPQCLLVLINRSFIAIKKRSNWPTKGDLSAANTYLQVDKNSFLLLQIWFPRLGLRIFWWWPWINVEGPTILNVETGG